MSEISINDIIDMMEEIEEDTSIPKNIRKTISEAKQRLRKNEDETVKIGAVVYMLEEIAEDLNIPSHARTQVWTILSTLESMKNEN